MQTESEIYKREVEKGKKNNITIKNICKENDSQKIRMLRLKKVKANVMSDPATSLND